MKLSKVLVFTEVSSLLPELCSGGNLIADETIAVVLGPREAAENAAGYCKRVIWIGEKAGSCMFEDYVPAIVELVKRHAPDMILIGSTRRGRCIAGRLAVRTDSGVCNGANAFEVTDPHTAQLHRMVYGGAATATVKAENGLIALVGSGLFEACELSAAGVIEEAAAAPVCSGIVCTEVNKKIEERVNLGAAKRVVSVGRGIGSQENIAVAEALAKKLGAEMACSRPVAEGEHWMPKNRYVGVSGAVIKPEVYIACGISGQVQHLVGIRDAKTVLAINKDKNAPIFKHCDYGIVGDLNKIIPAMTELL